MKPHKGNRNQTDAQTGVSEDQDHELDQDLIQQLTQGWEELDAMTPVFTPSQHAMEQMVEEHRRTMRRRFRRDLVLFLTVACIVLFATLAAIAQVPAVFAVVQVAAFLAGSLILKAIQKKLVKEP